jgi:hypothetical protein
VERLEFRPIPDAQFALEQTTWPKAASTSGLDFPVVPLSVVPLVE